ncbi:tRNA (N(6)-L-threonylcarbamoyladenosine(37)-C(2))-methylthiotransferase MtaB [Merdimmobilis hominis]|jgi:threonylcarbamoyladenosine tRNA methylthiotransferase MtaB|uniref:tRNA (N(6)-L-threonylcarbamoyladenosine(37)-C(2))- methylthiotransferase MtaB n=2 Tax=Merdimmobilis hominis TaxID=2897707 RepID=UPI001E4D8460|nr:tRNA (N(6)-L-threonylcarbamoyladenosine(37)-C(2))-methylthiotransferase MtaB [Merdimmobilis hominis]MCD4837061.1 tRNA (N(6)-L-threonylcarbamoyladenosine(37)-C(2))-methylthiotransferase MtaB [Merdimmobilis hominis]
MIAMRIAFYTLGCKVNQYETQVLSQQFAAAGFDLVEPTDIADVYVVNSCTVTSSGDKKTRQILRRLKRQNPAAKVALTGCFPQAFPDAAEAFTEADVITGSYNRASLLPAIRECLATGSRVVNITAHQKGEAFEDMKAGKFFEKTRASIKIEDGCERYCAYCIIPYARGPVRSKPLMDLKLELTELAAAGYKEVVLVGINLSAYGKDFGGHLTDAIALACTTDGIERVRLGSIEPEMITDKDLEEMARYPRLCPQFHLALQSGCDATLKRMNRKYDTAEYRRMVGKIRELFENPSITTDIMVGFPGETEEEFASTLQFVEEIGLAKAHVFSYSIREGTAAARMSGQVDPQVKEERSARLIAATGKTRQEFLQNQVGTVQEVLFETQTGGLTHGYSKNYTPVFVKTDEDVTGAILRVEITGAEADHCIGRIL